MEGRGCTHLCAPPSLQPLVPPAPRSNLPFLSSSPTCLLSLLLVVAVGGLRRIGTVVMLQSVTRLGKAGEVQLVFLPQVPTHRGGVGTAALQVEGTVSQEGLCW